MTAPAAPKALRCAIYSRKSSEEGLEQAFNSLHAQREACEAYIKSQAHEGWKLLGEAYDDGGFSGGSMERPALQRLMADIAAGKVDVVAVYKVDRLTRSLADFARIVEAFDAKGVSFVSITQAFNTTTSMGRLTLNVLLSFAQFEREVTGERIRDKIAASKKKGMWMGGSLPLGYDAGDHTLVINPAEADQVRHIFRRYLELGSVHLLRDELEQQGLRSKAWISRRGHARGGKVFGRGALFHLLKNRHYVGQIVHGHEAYPGRHTPIIDQELFDQVQARLAANAGQQGRRKDRAAQARLTGRIFGSDGAPMAPTFAYGHRGKLYRYYVAAALQRAGKAPTDDAPTRIPGAELESFMLESLRRIAGRPEAAWAELDRMLVRLEIKAQEVHLLLDQPRLLAKGHPQLQMEALTARLQVGERALVEVDPPKHLRVILPVRLSFRGGRTWIIGAAGAPTRRVRRQDAALAAGLRSAHSVLMRHGLRLSGVASRDGRTPANAYERRLCMLAMLAPELQRLILEHRQDPRITLQAMVFSKPPLLWEDQRRWLQALAAPKAG